MELSGLSCIEIEANMNPFNLFGQWINEAKQYCPTSAMLMNLATSSRCGDVSNRALVLRDLLDDGSLVIMTNKNSQKIKDITENPKVAACFVWIYMKDNKKISRQVQINGIAEKLPQEICQIYYDREPLYCQIRSHICQQDDPVVWSTLKARHDGLLREVQENKKELPMPNYQVCYKIVSQKMDFYYAWDNFIADRVLFTRINESEWKWNRISA